MGNNKFNLSHANFNNSQVLVGDKNVQYVNHSGEKQNLIEAAAEIQQLLKQIQETNPIATEAQQEMFVSAAITPNNRQRLINAFKEGGRGAIEEFLDNPYLNVAIKIIEGWRNL